MLLVGPQRTMTPPAGVLHCSSLNHRSYPGGSINQIPGKATISGDVRVTPFYDMAEVGGKVGVASIDTCGSA